MFGCVSAALFIYGVSYWHGRQLIEKIVGAWIIDLSKSRVNSTVHDIETRLFHIERTVFLLLPKITEKPEDLSPWQQLLLQEGAIETISLIQVPDKDNNIRGETIARNRGYGEINSSQAAALLRRCQSGDLSSQTVWSSNIYLNRSGLGKCVIYNQSQDGKRRYLILEVNLDWLPSIVSKNFTNDGQLPYLNIAQPFVLDQANQQWLIKPKNETSLNNNHDIVVSEKLQDTNLLIGLILCRNKLEQFQQKYVWLMIVSMFKDMLLMCLVIALISQLTTKPLRALNTSTQEMAAGNLNTELPAVTSDDEVGRLTQSFRQMRDSLLIYIDDLTKTTTAKQKLESELLLAAQIQRTMLPRIKGVNNPNSPYDISAILKPARIVGGDFYDFFLLGNTRLYLIIGDVADKGVPSALQMARTITLIRTLTKSDSTPREILNSVNIELCAENEDCLFVTVFCALLELNSGKLTYASGGHDAPILIRNGKARYLELETMPPLGLYEDSQFIQQQEQLYANDLILLYTDGITEAMNEKGELFSDTRLIEMIAAYPPTNTAKAVRAIEHFCKKFVAGAPQSDDITLLALQYLPNDPFLQVTNTMEWRLTVNSELTDLGDVKQNLSKILHGAHLSEEIIDNSQLIAEEIFVNIIEYGYGDSRDNYINLRIEIDSDYLTMTFEDTAKAFNPVTNITVPDLEPNDIHRPIGGLGFFLVQELAQTVDYDYRDGKNILTVRQKIAIE
ncbi:MAG: hypothetical protein N5P05_000345 [Chroococcopsis gigantea SAG 12.99]|nr:hypothetical protein [Chroococcopsis gigantea SAG 12.99]